jgi:branched-chain amino acid transport system substrate-binding protein
MKPTARVWTTLVALPLLLTACSSRSATPGSSDTRTGDPIVVGAISTETGGPSFPESAAAAKAYFDDLNTRGGINGRPVKYLNLDDAFNSTRLAQNARELVGKEGAVALVGSASVLDCVTNSKFYETKDVVSIPGAGVLPQCFTSRNIAPTNTGQFMGIGVNIVYAAQTLHKKAPCTLGASGNGQEAAVAAAAKAAEAKSGVKVKLSQFYPNGTRNWAPFLLRAKAAGCDIFLPDVAGPDIVALEKTVTQLGLRESMPTLELASAYNNQTGAALKGIADGVVANSEFLPFSGGGESDPGLAEYVALMKKANQPLSAFGEGGYLAARFFTKAVGGIHGEVTAATVTQALRTMPPVSDPMMGTPFVFGPGDSHQPNTSSRYVQLKDGVWVPVSTAWTTLPLSH